MSQHRLELDVSLETIEQARERNATHTGYKTTPIEIAAWNAGYPGATGLGTWILLSNGTIYEPISPEEDAVIYEFLKAFTRNKPLTPFSANYRIRPMRF